MRKITLLLFALLLATVGAWAQSAKIQPSTNEETPEHVYLLVNGNDVFMDKGTGDVRDNEARGRFAFYAVDGKEGFYKIMSYDSNDTEGKWLYYEETGSARNKVSFVTSRDDAKMWKITETTILGGATGYQLQPCNEDGSAKGTYMNWNGGVGTAHTSAGFYTTPASGDSGSGWILVLAPMDGKEFILQDNCGVFLNLETLGVEANDHSYNKLATLTASPAKCKISVTESGYWKIHITKEGSEVYLGQHPTARRWNTWVDAGQSNFNWVVELVKVEGVWHYMLRHYSEAQSGYLGCDTHGDGQALYVNQSDNAKKLKMRLYDCDMAAVTVKIQNTDDNTPRREVVLQLPVGETVNLEDYIPMSPLVVLDSHPMTVGATNEEQILTYQYNADIPFAADYVGLGGDEAENKWVSFFTLNGRMFVRDPQTADGDTEKNPAIDKATFTRLTDAHFWGFICDDPFAYPAIVKIVNKDVKDGKGLRLTKDQDNAPLRFEDKDGQVPNTWGTDQWIIETGRTNNENGQIVQYYGIRANTAAKNRYINNNAGRGFMTTYTTGPIGDPGSNIKFIIEQTTYDILKDRALTAPYNAVHSLNQAAREAVENSKASTVVEYKELINGINSDEEDNAETGYVQFKEGAYYFIRNYTPEGQNVYALGTENGTAVKGMTVTMPGSTTEAMKSSDPNMIWKIEKNGEAPTVGPGVGMSRTIPRLLKHVNSDKYFRNVDALSLVEKSSLVLSGDNGLLDNYYFVDLGAGQHFMKNVQYSGTGNQAQARPLSCGNNGVVKKGDATHKKNTRDTWYVIEATGLEVTIGETGYATIYLPFGVTMPNGLTAYAVIATDNATATLDAKTSIPAGEGAILHGAPGTYTLTINDDVDAWSDNKLDGSNMTTYVKGEAYVLAKVDSNVGLYKAALNKDENGAEGTTHFQNNGNKAYLLASAITGTTGEARFLSFDFGTVTGLDVIKGTESASSESAVYDLSGRRVRNAQKGLYIVNGKKVVK